MNERSRKLMQAARTTLVLYHPFFGNLALRLELQEDPNVCAMATNGRQLRYNPIWVEKQHASELEAVFAHEVLHCANGHPWRRDSRDPRDWNRACDYAINPILVDAGLRMPPDVLLDPRFKGLCAEQIYSTLHQTRRPKAQGGQGQGAQGRQQQPQQQQGPENERGKGPGEVKQRPRRARRLFAKLRNLMDVNGQPQQQARQPGQGDDEQQAQGDQSGQQPGPEDIGQVEDPTPETDESPHSTEADWNVATLQAVQAAKAMGKLPAGLERLIDEIKNPRVDWRPILRRFVQEAARADYSWRMPSLRYLAAGLYLPALRSEQMPPVICAVDTSGSISQAELSRFAAELNSVIEEGKPERTHVVYCDAKVQREEVFEFGEPVEFRPAGGGGTDFRPVFEWAEAQGIEPACLIFFTDLCGTFPDRVPDYPVLWALASAYSGSWASKATAPFGEIIRIEEED